MFKEVSEKKKKKPMPMNLPYVLDLTTKMYHGWGKIETKALQMKNYAKKMPAFVYQSTEK